MCLHGVMTSLDKSRTDQDMKFKTGRKKLLVLRVEPINEPIFVQDENSDTRPLYQGME